MFEAQSKTVVIPALNANYEVVIWTWNADENSATASVTVKDTNNNNSETTITADVTETGRTDAQCETDGSVVYHAEAKIGEFIFSNDYTVVITAPGHDYTSVVTAPTCTEGGYTTYTCSRCDDSYTADKTEALGHDFGEWTETTASSCTEKGEETRYCSRCDETETRTIDALGHDYTAVVTAPTCTEGGYTTYTCTRCGDIYTADETNALGHDFGEWTETTPATCTEDGTETRECLRCDAVETRTVDAFGHTPGETIIENEVPATCAAEGSYDEVVYCTVCGEELYRVVWTSGHSHEDENGDGYCDHCDVRACRYCGEFHDTRLFADWWISLLHDVLYVLKSLLMVFGI